jgi:hypothetical protein
MKKAPTPKSNVKACKDKINAILAEYDCAILSEDDREDVIIRDKITSAGIILHEKRYWRHQQ